MTDGFPQFAKLVATSIQKAMQGEVFVTDVDADELYALYLYSFPEGTNPIFKERSEHDCSCCKHFIRRCASMVTIDDRGVISTIWGKAAHEAPYPYNLVAGVLRDKVLYHSISNLFRVGTKETHFGSATSYSVNKETQRSETWHHFYSDPIPTNLRVESPDKEKGDYRTTVQVFERGLKELTPEAIETVLDLITSNALYRGEEKKAMVLQFQRAQLIYSGLDDSAQRTYAWANARGPAARFRSDVIGTLVIDLSEGMEVEAAVRSFESKVAPTNYQRPTAVITPMMIKSAMKTIAELDLESALERRFAVFSDISVRDVLWVDGSAKPLMKGGLMDILIDHAMAVNPKATGDEEKRAEEISLDAFMETVLPTTTGMEVLFDGEHLGNLMSLTAPVHPEIKQLFKWPNDFAWTYAGGVADSISERVKKAGGKVEGALLRVSLSWSNLDDLDIHIYEPAGRGVASVGGHIFYGNKMGFTKGHLDVDMNAGGPKSRTPVENVAWSVMPADGAYKVVVHQFSMRETNDPGFVVEVENAGKISHFSYNKGVRQSQEVHVATLHLKNGIVEKIEIGDSGITSANVAQDRWGLTTGQYAKVSTVVLSPNHWGEEPGIGNKHIFFILDKAVNDEPCRGFHNEFLHSRLTPHRKVMEVVAEKTKCRPTPGQLSGLGFSSTKKDHVIVRVQQGKRLRLLKVNIAA